MSKLTIHIKLRGGDDLFTEATKEQYDDFKSQLKNERPILSIGQLIFPACEFVYEHHEDLDEPKNGMCKPNEGIQCDDNEEPSSYVLSQFSTKALAYELARREGVNEYYATAHNRYMVGSDDEFQFVGQGPATFLVITD